LLIRNSVANEGARIYLPRFSTSSCNLRLANSKSINTLLTTFTVVKIEKCCELSTTRVTPPPMPITLSILQALSTITIAVSTITIDLSTQTLSTELSLATPPSITDRKY